MRRRSRALLIAHPERELEPAQARAFMDAARRRREREPVAYILGVQGLPAARAARRPARADPAAGDRARGRGGAGAAAGRAGGRRGHGLGGDRAGAQGRAAGPRGLRHRRERRTRSTSRAPTRRGWASTSSSSTATCSRACEVDAVVSNPPYVEAGRRADARGRALRAARCALFAAPTGSTSSAAWSRDDAGAVPRARARRGPGRRGRGARARGGLRRRSERSATSRASSGVARRRGDDRRSRRSGARRVRRGRRRRRLPRRHGLRARVRPRERGGGRAALRAQGPPAGQAGGGDVLRSRRAAATSAACCRAASRCCCRTRSGASRSRARRPRALGVRVPFLAPVGRPVLQSSANLAGGPDARRLEDVPRVDPRGADLVIDGGELPGVPSTVIDLRTPECEDRRRAQSRRERSPKPRAQEPLTAHGRQSDGDQEGRRCDGHAVIAACAAGLLRSGERAARLAGGLAATCGGAGASAPGRPGDLRRGLPPGRDTLIQRVQRDGGDGRPLRG